MVLLRLYARSDKMYKDYVLGHFKCRLYQISCIYSILFWFMNSPSNFLENHIIQNFLNKREKVLLWPMVKTSAETSIISIILSLLLTIIISHFPQGALNFSLRCICIMISSKNGSTGFVENAAPTISYTFITHYWDKSSWLHSHSDVVRHDISKTSDKVYFHRLCSK